MSNITNLFFALLKNETIKRISLSNEVTEEINAIFIKAKAEFITKDTEEVLFDGNYNVQEEEILFVKYKVPENISNAIKNPMGCHVLDLNNDEIKGLFWGVKNGNEVKEVYLQTFDSRKLLKNKQILLYSSDTYSKLTESAFILDDRLAAILMDEKLYFPSYHNAKRLFDLSEFYKEATDDDIDEFAKNSCIELDTDWLKDNANTNIRKQVTLALKSDTLKNKSANDIKSKADDLGFSISINNNKVVIPQDKKDCKELLEFFNEQFYKGIFSGKVKKANSVRDYQK